MNVFVFVYLNDILIYTKNERTYVNENDLLKKHISQIKSVLKKLKKFNLYVKFNKCRFYAKKIDFLNFQIFSIEISMQKNRMLIVQNWFMFCSHRNVQTFIKFVNFYRRFVNEFFKIIANLIDLLKKAINEKFSFKFKLIVEKKEFFKRFKIVFTTIFMLWHFFFEFKIFFETDSSNFAISNIIFQLFENEKWHSVVYWFKKMIFSKRNYVVEKQKLLIIVEACKQ